MVFFLLKVFGVPVGLPIKIAILYAAVPCAGNACILSQQMGDDHEMMAVRY
jgi:predicted permease